MSDMRVYSAVLGLAFASGPALASTDAAADGYAARGYDAACCSSTWTGFYVGVNGGYGWSDHSDKFAVPPVFQGIDPQGGFGGGQIGYNWQSANFVFGVEADIQGSGISDHITFLGVPFDSRLDYFGSVRGRLGYTFGPSLLYVTGGFAYGGIKNEVDALGVSFVSDHTTTGFTVGGGWEYKFARAWSLKAEYQFIDLGRNDPQFTTGGTTFRICDFGAKCEDDTFHTIRIGLNYQFGDRY
jgi:outer membrane immunogenic protein